MEMILLSSLVNSTWVKGALCPLFSNINKDINSNY